MAEEANINEVAQEQTPVAPATPKEPAPQPVSENQAGPELNISDLNTVKSIIDIATTRGAFKANELEAVGKTYNKLSAFLDHVSKQSQANQEPKGENNG